jgi:hypothetical protein
MGILGTDMTTQNTNQGKSIFAAGIAVAGWAVPGLGHALIGERVRGIVLCAVILATYWTGTAIGGAMTVDARYDKWWSYAQLGAGASGVYGWMRQEEIYRKLEADEEIAHMLQARHAWVREQNKLRAQQRQPLLPVPHATRITPSADGRPDDLQMKVDQKLTAADLAVVNPAEGIARAFTGVAGLLNLLCAFDAAMLVLIGRRKRGEDDA